MDRLVYYSTVSIGATANIRPELLPSKAESLAIMVTVRVSTKYLMAIPFSRILYGVIVELCVPDH